MALEMRMEGTSWSGRGSWSSSPAVNDDDDAEDAPADDGPGILDHDDGAKSE
jgi:hypothetical protein